jgi:gas vesicle protein
MIFLFGMLVGLIVGFILAYSPDSIVSIRPTEDNTLVTTYKQKLHIVKPITKVE